MHISYKAFNIARGIGAAGVLAFAGWALHAPVWLSIAASGVIAGGVIATASRVVDRAEMFVELSYDNRRSIVRWISVAALVHVAWIAGVEIRPDLAAWWVLGLAGIAAVEYYTAVGLEYLMTQPVHAEVMQARLERAEARTAESEQPTPMVGFSDALDRCRLGWLHVVDWRSIGSSGVEFEVQVPSQAPTGKDGAELRLTAAHAERIAIALSEVLGIPLLSDLVGVTKTPFAGRYLISIVTEDVMARVIPFEDTLGPDGCAVPLPLNDPPFINGYQINGAPVHLKLNQHGQIVGKTREGKTSGINVKLARLLQGGAEVWVCGREKLYDLLAGWLLPYEGTDRKTPFDWVMYGQQDTLEMMAGAMRLARYRQNVPLSKRRRWRTIVILMDEASFVLEDTTTKIFYDGRWCDASTMAAMGTKATGSADEWWWFATQRGTNDQLGGGTTKANIGFTEVYRTKDPAELGRCLGDEYYKLPRPRHKGQNWIDTGDGEPLSEKAPYIQEVDPARDRLHDGATVADISWARRNLILEEPLDEFERAAIGDIYVKRRRTADELVEYLTGQRPAPVNTMENVAYESAWSALEALGIKRPGTVAIEAAPPAVPLIPADAPPAAPPSPAASRKDRIVRLVADRGEMRTGEILDALRAELGEDLNRTSVMNTLRELVNEDGRLARPSDGVYRAA